MRAKLACCILVSMGIAATQVHGESVTLTPAKDNTIIQWSPESPDPNPLLANGLGDVFAGRSNQDGQDAPTVSIRRGLLQFSVAGAVPAGAAVTGVTLTMREVMGNNGDPTVSLHRALSDWGEGASFFAGGRGAPAEDGDATWFHMSYNAATPAANLWELPGGDFEPTASAGTVVADDFGEGHTFSWSGAGLIADVEAWLDESAENFGWMLIGDEAHGRTVKRFNSSNPNEEDEGWMPPTLHIEFEPAFAGDYNDDGVVDAADYTVWRNHVNQMMELPNETVTPGMVNGADYAEWKSHYGAVEMELGAGGVTSVPEPAGGVLGVTGMAIVLLAGRRL